MKAKLFIYLPFLTFLLFFSCEKGFIESKKNTVVVKLKDKTITFSRILQVRLTEYFYKGKFVENDLIVSLLDEKSKGFRFKINSSKPFSKKCPLKN